MFHVSRFCILRKLQHGLCTFAVDVRHSPVNKLPDGVRQILPQDVLVFVFAGPRVRTLIGVKQPENGVLDLTS